uniref:CSON006579 protein n=1 Tax=Culicoides sonorensis TaxID=179676 RepID=A0A336LX10_CULSO
MKFADSHPRDIEELWGTLCQFWPNNLKVILRYLVIISGMAPNELLSCAKRVALYLARTCPDRLLDELMTELQTVETLNCLIERTETPPFYRLTSMRKTSSHSDGPTTGNTDMKLQDGTIHTKRHSGEDPIKSGTCKSDSALRAFSVGNYRPPRGSDKIRTASGPAIFPRHEDVLHSGDTTSTSNEGTLERKTDAPNAPHPLPMPEYGGWFAPLTEFLPDSSVPISGFHRCNVAVMLLADVIVDGIENIDWTLHVPLMLHILFLGLDHTRPLVRDNCKQLLLNLLIVLCEHNDHLTVARVLLNSETQKLKLGLTIPNIAVVVHNFTEPNDEFDAYLFGPPAVPATTSSTLTICPAVITGGTAEEENDEGNDEKNENRPNTTSDANQTVQTPKTQIPSIITEENSPPQPGPTMATAHVIKSLIRFLTQDTTQPLWNYEDITAKVWLIKSAEQLSCLLRYILKVFSESFPQARFSERWAQTALQLGLSCSSRHYAGRSLQVFRALGVPINSRMLSDILSRLVETVAEQGEDMQGYVTELLLTLEAAVDSLDSDFRPLDVMKDIFKSTPNLNNKDGAGAIGVGGKKSADGTPGSPQAINSMLQNQGHTRSTSYSVSYCTRRTTQSPIDKQVELRNRAAAAMEAERNNQKFGGALSRSRSAQSLKLLGDTATQDDKMTILAQLFWLAVSLLESDFEHEFLLALRLLGRVLYRLPLDRPDARDKVEKLQLQLKWPNFPGVHALLLKGCTHTTTYEPSVTLLSKFAPLLTLPVCDPTQSCAFPMNVIALLPYMLLHYEDANEVCISSAENIAQVASEMGSKLENLGTVMTLYSRKTFSKDPFQWTKCVVKYVHDTYAHMGITMLAFLVDVLEKGWAQVQMQVLSVIHCMLHYVDLSTQQAQPLCADLLRVISKFLDTPHWREALKILKLVVTRSSTLQVVPQYSEKSYHHHGSYSDSEVFCKKELAGRTMDFTFDVSQTPLIGRRLLLKGDSETNAKINAGVSAGMHLAHFTNSSSPRRSASLSPADTGPISGWKRPWMCQGRVRECLVNLLTTCGQRVGLPKSPSVIFSQSSDLLERQSSAASSTDETSGPQQDLSGGSRRDDQPDFTVFRDFDFLEYESESVECDSTDNFNWGVRRRPLSEGDSEPIGELKPTSGVDESVSENTPVLAKRSKRQSTNTAYDSSDEELETESPHGLLRKPLYLKSSSYLGGPPTSLSLKEHRHHRRDSVSRSDTSGSSVGDLGDITPCNESPHLTGLLPFRAPIRDETEEAWRKNLKELLINQPSSHAPELLDKLYLLIRELTIKSIFIAKDSMRYFTGVSTQLGHRLSVLADLLSSRGEPPKIWYNRSLTTTPRLHETLRYAVLEVQEHLETFFDRKEHVIECLDSVKTSCKYALFSDMDSSNEGTGTANIVDHTADPATMELLIDLGRGLYKLMFQLLLLIESDHKIAINVVQSLRQNDRMTDLSKMYMSVRGAILRSIDETEMESLDTSTSTEGENTPTPSPVPINSNEFELMLVELIDGNRWTAAINYVKQHKQLSNVNPCFTLTSSNLETASSLPKEEDMKSVGDLNIIMDIYSQKLIKDRNDAFIISRQEAELNEIHVILMENLLHVSAALAGVEISVATTTSTSSSSTIKDTVDIITTL